MRKLSYKEMRQLGLCTSCGKDNPTPEKSLCPACNERRNQNRRDNGAYYKSIGVCVRCHKNKAEPNKAFCYECAAKEPVGRYSAMDLKRVQKHRQERLKQGLCPKCGKRPAINDGLCAYCRAYLKRYRDRTRKDIPRSEWTTYDRCYCCGSTDVLPGKKVCSNCYDVRIQTLEPTWGKTDNSYWRSTNTIKTS